MRLDSNINTPFGSLEVALNHWPTHEKHDFKCLVFGDVTINRVDYRLRQEWHRSPESHVWTLGHQDLNRQDNNQTAAYPIKAREKARDAVYAILVNFITPAKLNAAQREEMENRIQRTADAIEQHREEMERNQTLLAQLRLDEIALNAEAERIQQADEASSPKC